MRNDISKHVCIKLGLKRDMYLICTLEFIQLSRHLHIFVLKETKSIILYLNLNRIFLELSNCGVAKLVNIYKTNVWN